MLEITQTSDSIKTIRFPGEWECIGSYMQTDGGYLAFSNRKPVATENEVIVQVLEKAIRQHLRTIKRLRSAIGEYR